LNFRPQKWEHFLTGGSKLPSMTAPTNVQLKRGLTQIPIVVKGEQRSRAKKI